MPSEREAWVGLESNPTVMTKYARSLGVADGWGFCDLWGLDDEALEAVPQPCVAAIFLYPFSQVEARKRALGTQQPASAPEVWHMRQDVSNACGSVAIMHSVMNNLDRIGEGSSFLDSFREKTAGASSAERAALFAPAVRDIHDSHASSGQTDAPAPTADLDFHFVAYVEAPREAERRGDRPRSAEISRDRLPLLRLRRGASPTLPREIAQRFYI
mmetsp:Transcript_22498/g.70557  ORF Transcript_22498/g.70557 Transcript_22498/m.70557 type:complete len:215 (-) Transcript_22498:1-645(-)